MTSRIVSGLFEGNLFAPVAGRRYDLILANPPYVATAEVAAFPAEYRAEPEMAHLGGKDGQDLVRAILAVACDHLQPHGTLVVEVGSGRGLVDAEFPNLPLIWLDTEESEGEVLAVAAGDLSAALRPGGRPVATKGE